MTRLALATVVGLGMCVPALADPPDPPVWEVWAIDYHGDVIDRGLVAFMPLDPATGEGVYAQWWDSGEPEVGYWWMLMDLGHLGCWLKAKPDVPARHYGIELLCLNPHETVLGKVWDRTCSLKIGRWGGFYLACGLPAK